MRIGYLSAFLSRPILGLELFSPWPAMREATGGLHPRPTEQTRLELQTEMSEADPNAGDR